MNRIKTLFLMALCAIVMVACENGHNNDLPNNPIDDKCYKGTMVVDQNDGTFYTQNDVEVDCELRDGKINFVMYKVKFANGMPIKLDMVVEGVDYTETEDGYELSGDGIIPFAMGGPFEKFTITNLTGTVTSTAFTLDFMCGEYPVTYEGTK